MRQEAGDNMGLYDRDYMHERRGDESRRAWDGSAASRIESALAGFWARHPRLPLAAAGLLLLLVVLSVLAIVLS